MMGKQGGTVSKVVNPGDDDMIAYSSPIVRRRRSEETTVWTCDEEVERNGVR